MALILKYFGSNFLFSVRHINLKIIPLIHFLVHSFHVFFIAIAQFTFVFVNHFISSGWVTKPGILFLINLCVCKSLWLRSAQCLNLTIKSVSSYQITIKTVGANFFLCGLIKWGYVFVCSLHQLSFQIQYSFHKIGLFNLFGWGMIGFLVWSEISYGNCSITLSRS